MKEPTDALLIMVLEVLLLEIRPYLYIVSPLCTSLTLIRLYKFYTLRMWASLQKTRRVLSALREENNFALPLIHVHLQVYLGSVSNIPLGILLYS